MGGAGFVVDAAFGVLIVRDCGRGRDAVVFDVGDGGATNRQEVFDWAEQTGAHARHEKDDDAAGVLVLCNMSLSDLDQQALVFL